MPLHSSAAGAASYNGFMASSLAKHSAAGAASYNGFMARPLAKHSAAGAASYSDFMVPCRSEPLLANLSPTGVVHCKSNRCRTQSALAKRATPSRILSSGAVAKLRRKVAWSGLAQKNGAPGTKATFCSMARLA